jgi:sterol 3beta-glucosyltransferase
MKIGLQTWGSYGDVRPFISLAAGLQSCGHDVTLVVTSTDGSDYSQSALQLGVKIIGVPSNKIVVSENYFEIGRSIINEPNLVKQTKLIISNLILPMEAEMYCAAEELCRERDIIIGHSFHYPVQTAAQKFRRPYLTVTLNPSVIPSSDTPPTGLPNYGKRANAFFWWLAKSALNNNVKPYVDQLRRRNGLENAVDLISDVWLSHELNLIAVSKEICAVRSDWNDTHQICGFFNVANIEKEGKAPAELEQFLERGAPPVYMTFGSMVSENIQEQTEIAHLFAEAVQLSGCRAIIQLSLWEDCRLSPSESICYVKTSPHELIFPKCAAVVHHGGAGTSQAVMLAGIPSIVVPQISDQYFWGREMNRLGIAPEMLPIKKMTINALAERIKLVLSSMSMQTQARKVGLSMRNENGVAKAVQLINEKYRA